MKIGTVLLTAGVIGVVTIATIAPTAFAWHPDGKITKKVQNVTTNSSLVEADTKEDAVAAKPGDTLKYVIEVRNDGKPDTKNYNDMAKIVMTDTLPDGIALKSNPAQRQLSEKHDLLKPGEKKTWEYLVTVTSKSAGTITNTACFTGDSTANDNPQKGCNPAVVNATVPPTTPEPEKPVPVVPAAPITPVTPAELPKTGATENIVGSALALGAVWYAVHRYLASKREMRSLNV